ncbi:MAG: hypothetical protein HYT27_02440 [Parcubacteria group bacterium]|nr:hypothetical protein [Parcubacteria group bacterium]
MKRSFRVFAVLGIIFLSACGYGDFEKSPFNSASIFVYESEAYVVFNEVFALDGNKAVIDLADEIIVTVDESLEKGTAVLSGSIEKSITQKYRTRLKSVTVFLSSAEEKQRWMSEFLVAKEKYQLKKKPREVRPPTVYDN